LRKKEKEKGGNPGPKPPLDGVPGTQQWGLFLGNKNFLRKIPLWVKIYPKNGGKSQPSCLSLLGQGPTSSSFMVEGYSDSFAWFQNSWFFKLSKNSFLK